VQVLFGASRVVPVAARRAAWSRPQKPLSAITISLGVPMRRSAILIAVCRVRPLLVFGLLLAGLPPLARAGGTNVAVATTAGHVWVTTGVDVVELDARSGRVERRTRTRYPFPLELGLSDGNVWVSSVQDAFVAGAVTRIPFMPGRVSQPLVLPTRPVYSLAVGSGTTWALIGPWVSPRLAAIDQATERTTLRPIHGVGWIAADDTGATPGLFGVTTDGHAVEINADASTSWTAKTGRIESPPAVGLGSVWVASRTSLYRLESHTGKVQARVSVASSALMLTTGGGYVWAVVLRQAAGSERDQLLKIDPHHEQIVVRAALEGPASSVSYGSGALWIGRDTATVSVLQVDPHTLKQTLIATNLDSTVP
jgi:hypothetical protein